MTGLAERLQDAAPREGDFTGLGERAVQQMRAREALGHEVADRFVDGASFLLDSPATVQPLWGEDDRALWAEGESLMLIGPTGAGKTTIAQQVALGRIGLRADVLGLPVLPGEGKVLYAACDRPSQAARSLRRMVTADDYDTLRDRLVFWKGPPPRDFAKHPDTLVRMAVAAGADTVVIDSVKDVALKLTDDEVGAAFNRARQLALVYGVQLVELHHTRKSSATNARPNKLEDVYGSTWLTAGAGSVVVLWGAAGDPIVELTHLKQPASEVGPFRVMHDHDRGLSTVFQTIDVLALVDKGRGVTAQQIARLMFSADKPDAAQVEKARRRLDRLVTEGLIVRRLGQPGEPSHYWPRTLLEEAR